MLLPATCPSCGALGAAPCAPCAARLRPAPELPPPPGLDRLHALVAYAGPGRELVARLKYRPNRVALPGLARAMAALVDPGGVDVVTWSPTTPARRRQRGFDPAELLARAVARELRRPCRPLLLRLPGPAQTGRRAAARRWGPALRPRRRVDGRVLLVDDVVTTGATLAASAAALRSAGASAVVGLVAARTALKAATRRDDT